MKLAAMDVAKRVADMKSLSNAIGRAVDADDWVRVMDFALQMQRQAARLHERAKHSVIAKATAGSIG